MSQMSARGKSYNASVMMTALGISRATLRYYESLGIVNPDREPGSNYRIYTNEDLFTTVEAIMFKNAGYQISEAGEALAGDLIDARELVSRYVTMSERRHKIAEAMCESFSQLQHVLESDFAAKPHLTWANEWLVHYDGCEKGYDLFDASETQDYLMAGMPISAFAAIVDVDVFSHEPFETRWGRAVPVQYADLLLRAPDETSDEAAIPHDAATPTATPARHFGGCACLTTTYRADWDKIPGFDPDHSVRDRLGLQLHELGLEQAGPIVAPNVLPVCGKVYCDLYLPVQARSIKGRMAIGRIK